jgi:hypothetical protein
MAKESLGYSSSMVSTPQKQRESIPFFVANQKGFFFFFYRYGTDVINFTRKNDLIDPIFSQISRDDRRDSGLYWMDVPLGRQIRPENRARNHRRRGERETVAVGLFAPSYRLASRQKYSVFC